MTQEEFLKRMHQLAGVKVDYAKIKQPVVEEKKVDIDTPTEKLLQLKEALAIKEARKKLKEASELRETRKKVKDAKIASTLDTIVSQLKKIQDK